MSAILNPQSIVLNQPQIRFMDKRSSLEKTTGGFASQSRVSDPTQFTVDQGNQGIEGTLVAIPPSNQQAGDVLVGAATRHRSSPVAGHTADIIGVRPDFDYRGSPSRKAK